LTLTGGFDFSGFRRVNSSRWVTATKPTLVQSSALLHFREG